MLLKFNRPSFHLFLAAIAVAVAVSRQSASAAEGGAGTVGAATTSAPAEGNDAQTLEPAEAAKSQKMPKSAENESGKSAQWAYQMRIGLGAGRNRAATNFKSDRLGFGLFMGRTLPEFDLPFADGKDIAAGLAYQTFTGVDSSSDSQWSLQSIGPQARMKLGSLSFVPDVSVSGGFLIQRLLSEKGARSKETVTYGIGLSSSVFAHWPIPILDGMHSFAGAEILLGKATWFAVATGIEASL